MRSMWVLLGSLCLLASQAGATVIGHDDVDDVASLPQATLDAVGQQRWLFTHASVGANILDGMTALHSSDPTRYQFTSATAGNWSQVYPAPASTDPGVIYDGARGNPGWAAKFAMFDDAVRDLGWHAPLIDAAMDKLCYIDPSADVSTYLAIMTALETDYPATRFIYMTMPLQSGEGANGSNILATNYNNAVRAHCAGADRLLFDIADIECHDPSGNAITFTDGGHVYERLYSGYTSDGGHLNALGAQRAALGWYATAAAMTQDNTAVPEVSTTAPPLLSVAPNPLTPASVFHFTLDRSAYVELDVYDICGRRVERLAAGMMDAGAHSVAWGAAGFPSGVYLTRFDAGGAVSFRKIVVAR